MGPGGQECGTDIAAVPSRPHGKASNDPGQVHPEGADRFAGNQFLKA